MTKSCGVTFARSSIRSTITSGVRDPHDVLARLSDFRLERALLRAAAAVAVSRTSRRANGAFERCRRLRMRSHHVPRLHPRMRCAYGVISHCHRLRVPSTSSRCASCAMAIAPEQDHHQMSMPAATACIGDSWRQNGRASVSRSGPGTSTSEVALSRSSGNRRTNSTDGRFAGMPTSGRVFAEERAPVEPCRPAREVASLEFGEEPFADLRAFSDRLKADASPLARRFELGAEGVAQLEAAASRSASLGIGRQHARRRGQSVSS